MATKKETTQHRWSSGRITLTGCAVAGLLTVAIWGWTVYVRNTSAENAGQHLNRIYWGGVPKKARQAALDTGQFSNIKREDYVGPETCRKCHRKQHADWLKHPHSVMNALASTRTIKGDFDNKQISYRGGKVRFYRHQDEYRMELKRGSKRREYVVNQTIGSRHLQFYVGKQVSGSETSGRGYEVNHVLPMGYEIGRRKWMPATNVGWDEVRYGEVVDPFHVNRVPAYHEWCISCHTTIPFGDLILKNSPKGGFTPRLKELAKMTQFSFHASGFLGDAHPDGFDQTDSPRSEPSDKEQQFLEALQAKEASDLAVTLGVSCEACHLGGKQHSENTKIPPRFFPAAPSLLAYKQDEETAYRRTAQNINLICARCHFNIIQKYSGGMATYNSTEFSDAISGACYSKLSCVKCHNPHQATGSNWSLPRAKEDGLCIQCHKPYDTPEKIVAHTHHPAGSEGSRCMNCHMPHITEGLSGVVRTHAIFSPTSKQMLKSNHPNACNLCHLDKPMNWTVQHLSAWYGAKFEDPDIVDHPDGDKPVGLRWLKSDHIWTRMAAGRAFSRQNARWALPQLVDLLDDQYVVSRQFLESELERMLGEKLAKFGYQFYQPKWERQSPLRKIRENLHQWMPKDSEHGTGTK